MLVLVPSMWGRPLDSGAVLLQQKPGRSAAESQTTHPFRWPWHLPFSGPEFSSRGVVKATSIQIFTYVIAILLRNRDIMNLHVFFIPLKTTETI